jgi:tetratricopeptide (TPR) repeat protein
MRNDSLDYGAALERSAQRVEERAVELAGERLEAPKLCAALLAAPQERRLDLVRDDARLWTWGVLERLIEESSEAAFRSPARAEELAQLALSLSDFLDRRRCPSALIEDLRAKAMAILGNARRLAADLHGSAEAFTAAAAHLSRGTGDPLDCAFLFDLEASLRRDQRRFDQAQELLGHAVDIYLREGERHRAGRSLVNLSTVYDQAASPEEAIPPLRRALELIDAEADPRLHLCAVHNLITNLVGCGRCDEARALYRRARPLYRAAVGDVWTRNHQLWVLGRIACGIGRLRRAETLLYAAREGFLAEGVPYDTALVALDLALIFAGQGRTGELRRLAEEMMPIFTSRQIHREALAALAFLKRAVEGEQATLELVSRVAAYLRRAEHDPALRFERSGAGVEGVAIEP